MAFGISSLVSSAAAKSGKVLLAASKQLIGLGANAVFNTITRAADYEANYQFPSALPGPGELINAYTSGCMTWDFFTLCMRYNGINLTNDAALSSQLDLDAWHRYIKSVTPAFDPDFARALFRQGLLTDLELYDHVKRGGLADREMFGKWLGWSDWPDPLELTALRLRGFIDEDKWKEGIRINGYTDNDVQKWLWQLSQAVPGPSEIVHFVLRHGFEPSVIQANRLNEEFPTSARDWLGKQGLNYEFEVTDPFTGKTSKTTWADMYWQTHWVPIAPSQAYTMLQRLRPNRVHLYQDVAPGVKPFTIDDVRRWLRINDYPPGVRDQLVAISYNPLGFRQIGNMLISGVVDENEAIELYQDQGFNRLNSARLVEQAKVQAQQKDISRLRTNSLSFIKRAYLAGALDRDQAQIRLWLIKQSGMTDFDAFQAMDQERQLVRARLDPQTRATINDWDTEAKIKQLETQVKTVKRGYVKGVLSDIQTRQTLATIGVHANRVDDLLIAWGIEKLGARRELTAAQIQKYYRGGIIGLPEAQSRLVNLNYLQQDVSVLLADTQRSILSDVANMRAKAARTQQQKVRAAALQVRALQLAQRKAVVEMLRHGTPAHLQKWYEKGIINGQEFQDRLLALGWPVADVGHAKAEADLVKSKESTPKLTSRKTPAVRQAPRPGRANLEKWLKLGIIGPNEFRGRMANLGYTLDDIERYISETTGQPTGLPTA